MSHQPDFERIFFREMKKLLDDPTIRKPHPALIDTVGVIWPSMRWADEAVPIGATAAAAGLGGPPSDAELVLALKDVFTEPVQKQALDEMATLLVSRPTGDEPLARFQALMRQLDTRILGGETPAQANAADAPEDNGERCGLLESPPREVFTRFAELARPPADEGGAAGLRDVLGAIWDGAKETLRTATYWQMKRRAGVVDMRGVGPLIGRICRERPDLRVHLLGHSFGGRVVAFALAGLPPDALSSKSPVKSVALLQGAFSHFAFAPMLPHDPARGGALKGVASRVDGPLIVTHSVHDYAVGRYYPAASFSARDDSAKLSDPLYRWRAMGDDGAQSVGAANNLLGPVRTRYAFSAGEFINLNGDNVIKKLEPISGAHGDIISPQIAWATLAAAGLVQSSAPKPKPPGRG